MSADPDAAPRKRWRQRALPWLRDILLFVLVIAAVQWWQARELAKETAPPLTGLLVDGTPYQLQPGAAPMLVHFWAEWCPVCRLGQDSIARIAQDHPVITIATNSGTPSEVQAYLRSHNLRMPVLVDEHGDVARQWGVYGVPATFVIDPAGTISHASRGYSTELGLRIRLWLAD